MSEITYARAARLMEGPIEMYGKRILPLLRSQAFALIILLPVFPTNKRGSGTCYEALRIADLKKLPSNGAEL